MTINQTIKIRVYVVQHYFGAYKKRDPFLLEKGIDDIQKLIIIIKTMSLAKCNFNIYTS